MPLCFIPLPILLKSHGQLLLPFLLHMTSILTSLTWSYSTLVKFKSPLILCLNVGGEKPAVLLTNLTWNAWPLTSMGPVILLKCSLVPRLHSPTWLFHVFSYLLVAVTKLLPLNSWIYQFSSVQSLSCVRLFATHESQHARPPCPSPTSRVYQTHVRQVGDANQASHPLSSPSPPAPNPSQPQSLSQWLTSSHEVAKVLEFQL